MAIFSLNIGIVKRSSGQYVTAAAAYRAGERIHDATTGLTHDYSRKNDVDGTAILLPEEAPAWMSDRQELWTQVEKLERRCDAQLARKMMMALPVELSPAENKQLVTSFIQKTCVDAGMVADVCYHDLDSHNPHAHVLLTMRRLEDDGFGRKERAWNDQAVLKQWREQWQEYANDMLEQSGFEERIDHRSLEAQGIEREPQIHLGPNVAAMRDKGIETDRGDLYDEIEARNELAMNLVSERDALDREIARLEAELAEADDNDELVADDAISSDAIDGDRIGALYTEGGGKPQEKAAAGSNKGGEVPHPDIREAENAIRILPKEADATTQAVQSQLVALGAERYEVLLSRRYDQNKFERITRRWSSDELLHSIPWLRYQNAQGFDIMLRPEKNQGYVVLDQLSSRQVERLRADGLNPSLVLNTHRNSYQAWVWLSSEPLPNTEAWASAQFMAQSVQGSAYRGQYGRLAGFTNQRVWQPEGQTAPFVRVIESDPQIPVTAPQLLEQVQVRSSRTSNQSVIKGLPRGLDKCLLDIEKPFKSERDACEYEFMYWYHQYFERFGKPRNTMASDWKICHILATRGFSAQAIKGTLRRQSPNDFQKEMGTFEQYVNSMVYRVMRRPEVVAIREQLLRERQPERAISRDDPGRER